jgi:hypothetical protein
LLFVSAVGYISTQNLKIKLILQFTFKEDIYVGTKTNMICNGAGTQPVSVAVLLRMKELISFLDVWWHG